MTDVIAASLADVKDAVESAIAAEHRLEVRGTGSKSNLGRACDFDATLDVSQMAGIVDYQPEELVMTLRAGTPMDVVENALADARQMLAFEPPRMGRISGGPRSELHGTIGGVVAANLSGPRRLTAGATRDYLLGFEAISGRGELFKSGGRVMKNVTGYDLSKLMCGSFGTLAVMDEITLKTLPAPETSQSLLVACADFRAAIKTIAQIFATPHEPGAAAILPQAIAAEEKVDTGGAFTAIIRLEGIAASVSDRVANLQTMTGGETVAAPASESLWQRIRDVQPLAEKPHDLWKVSCAPSDAPRVVAALDSLVGVRFMADWAGGLLWFGASRSRDLGNRLRAVVAELDSGFAMLVRDVAVTRDEIAPFQPLPSPLFELHKRVKASFDPRGVLNYGRMHRGI